MRSAAGLQPVVIVALALAVFGCDEPPVQDDEASETSSEGSSSEGSSSSESSEESSSEESSSESSSEESSESSESSSSESSSEESSSESSSEESSSEDSDDDAEESSEESGEPPIDMGGGGELFAGPCSRRDDIHGDGIFDQRFEWDYDDAGRVIEERFWGLGEFDQPMPSARTTSEYDADGQLIYRVYVAYDTITEEFVWMYDESGREIYHWYWEIIHVFEYGGPYQYEDITTYMGDTGLLERDVDLDGTINSVHTMVYDAEGRRIALAHPGESWAWGYDDQGREIREDRDYELDGVIDTRETTSWNDLDLQLEQTRRQGVDVDGPIERQIQWTWDAQGHELGRLRFVAWLSEPWWQWTYVWSEDFGFVEVLEDQGMDGTIEVRSEVTYDAGGNPLVRRLDQENDGVHDWESIWDYGCW